MFLWETNTFQTDLKFFWQESMQYYLLFTHIVGDFLILVIPFASVTSPSNTRQSGLSVHVTLDKEDYPSK